MSMFGKSLCSTEHWPNKADVIRTLIENQTEMDLFGKTIAHELVGNILWSVVESDSPQHRTIICNLIGSFNLRQPGDRLVLDVPGSAGDWGWGYEQIYEWDHPPFDDCPLSFLDLAPVADEGWRMRVRAYHARKRVG
jgi:hypothetical protein